MVEFNFDLRLSFLEIKIKVANLPQLCLIWAFCQKIGRVSIGDYLKLLVRIEEQSIGENQRNTAEKQEGRDIEEKQGGERKAKKPQRETDKEERESNTERNRDKRGRERKDDNEKSARIKERRNNEEGDERKTGNKERKGKSE